MAGMGYTSGLIDGLDLAHELAQDHDTLEDLVKDLDETRERHRTRWIRRRFSLPVHPQGQEATPPSPQ